MTIVGAGSSRKAAVAPVSFERFYASQWSPVVAVTAALCRDVGVAEELSQPAFLRAYRRWARVSRMDRPELWVRRVALNLAVSNVRRRRAESRTLRRIRGRQGEPVSEDLVGEVEEFWEALRSLPTRQAQAAALFYVDDLPVTQVAEVLGCAPGTVKAHLHAARRRLQHSLDHLGRADDAR